MGPTAVGKSDLGLWLAERFGGEIVSADSAQVYRGLDIGTAKPTPEERERVPHHLIDIKAPDEGFSLAEFHRLASLAVDEIHARGRPVFLVGGTGLYARALLEGYQLVEAAPDPELRARLTECSLDELVERLRELDPVALNLVDLKNPRRVSRAIEICLTTGRPFSLLGQRTPPGYATLKIGLTMARKRLLEGIDRRAERMLERGLLEEVRGLVEKGYGLHLHRLRLIGYTEMLEVLEGRITVHQATEELKKNTRRFSKRQMTWLRAEPELRWLDLEALGDGGREQAAAWVAGFTEEVGPAV